MSALTVETVESGDALAALAAPWRALEQASGNLLPFRTHEWVDSWWRHFAERRLLVEDRLAVRVVRAATGELVAAAPLMLTRHPGRGPLGIRFLQFFGADPNITELRGALLHPAHEAEAAAALVEELRGAGAGRDWLQWSGVAAGSALERALTASGHVHWTRDIPNYVLSLPATWEEFRAGRKRNIRESLRKCYNSLERDGHRFTLDVVSAPPEIPAAIEHFFTLHAMRAEVSESIAHRNVFDSRAARTFLLEVSQRFAERGATRVFVMRIEGKVVALRIGYVLGDSMYLYYSGYDPAWGKYSVMTTVVAEALRWAIGQGLRTVNLSTGNDVSKTRWGPAEHVYRDGIELVPGARGRFAHRSWEWAPGLRDKARLRGALRLLGRRRG